MRRTRVGIMLIAMAAASQPWTGTVGARWQRPTLEQSVDLTVPSAPVVLDVGGTPHLVHELHITNMRRQALALKRLQVIDQVAGTVVADLGGASLTRTLNRIGVPKEASDAHIVAPGHRTVSFLWIALPVSRSQPANVSHRLELAIAGADSNALIEVDGASVTVSRAPAVSLRPPLSGGPWVAIYDPLLMGGHRTAIYTLDGRARIPGRFAIDWIRAPGFGPDTAGNASDQSRRNGFGANVLAVADARVASLMDDMPDNAPDARVPAVPLRPEQGSGNYVALDLGGGRFAFYEHLRHKSIVVSVGERVRTGQVIAQLGGSGSTSIGPHLHFHVADANATLAAEGQPFVIRQFTHRGAYRSLDALLGGEPWIPASAGQSGNRELQHPVPVSVLDF